MSLIHAAVSFCTGAWQFFIPPSYKELTLPAWCTSVFRSNIFNLNWHHRTCPPKVFLGRSIFNVFELPYCIIVQHAGSTGHAGSSYNHNYGCTVHHAGCTGYAKPLYQFYFRLYFSTSKSSGVHTRQIVPVELNPRPNFKSRYCRPGTLIFFKFKTMLSFNRFWF